MAIKKGIVVLSGSTEGHKLLDDGSAVLGNAQTDLIMSGSVFVEGVTSDLVTEVETLVDATDSHRLSVSARIVNQSAAISGNWSALANAASASIASVRSDIDAEIVLNNGQMTSATTALSTLDSAALSAIDVLSSSISTQVSARGSAFSSLATRADAVVTEVNTIITGSSALFDAASGTYDPAVIGMVQYVIDADGTSDSALDASNLSLSTRLSTQVSTRLSADASLQTVLDGYETTRNNAFSLTGSVSGNLQNNATAHRETNISTLNSTRDSVQTSLSTRISAGDQTVTDNLGDANSGEISTRISADASLQVLVNALSASDSGSFASLAARLDAQELKRANNINSLTTKITTESTANSILQSTTDSLITDEATAEGNAYTAASGSLSTRIIAEKAAHDAEDQTLSSSIASENAARISRDSDLSTLMSTEVSLFDSSMTVLSGNVSTQVSTRLSNVASISTRISGTNATISEMIAGVDFDGNLSALVSFVDVVDGANDSAILAAIDTLTGTLATEVSNRISGDNSLSTLISTEESLRVSAVSVQDSTFVSMTDDHLVRTGSMKTATDNMFSSVQTDYVNTLVTSATSSIESEAGTRASEDNLVTASLDTEIENRQSTVLSLQTARISGDTSLQDRINALTGTLTTGQLTLNALSGASQLDVDGTVQVGRLDVAAVTAAGYLTQNTDHNGKLFYLDAPTGGDYAASSAFKAVFPVPQKWYFYEDGTWHPLPFYNDADGDNVMDQLDQYASNAYATSYPVATMRLTYDGWVSEGFIEMSEDNSGIAAGEKTKFAEHPTYAATSAEVGAPAIAIPLGATSTTDVRNIIVGDTYGDGGLQKIELLTPAGDVLAEFTGFGVYGNDGWVYDSQAGQWVQPGGAAEKGARLTMAFTYDGSSLVFGGTTVATMTDGVWTKTSDSSIVYRDLITAGMLTRVTTDSYVGAEGGYLIIGGVDHVANGDVVASSTDAALIIPFATASGSAAINGSFMSMVVGEDGFDHDNNPSTPNMTDGGIKMDIIDIRDNSVMFEFGGGGWPNLGGQFPHGPFKLFPQPNGLDFIIFDYNDVEVFSSLDAPDLNENSIDDPVDTANINALVASGSVEQFTLTIDRDDNYPTAGNVQAIGHVASVSGDAFVAEDFGGSATTHLGGPEVGTPTTHVVEIAHGADNYMLVQIRSPYASLTPAVKLEGSNGIVVDLHSGGGTVSNLRFKIVASAGNVFEKYTETSFGAGDWTLAQDNQNTAAYLADDGTDWYHSQWLYVDTSMEAFGAVSGTTDHKMGYYKGSYYKEFPAREGSTIFANLATLKVVDTGTNEFISALPQVQTAGTASFEMFAQWHDALTNTYKYIDATGSLHANEVSVPHDGAGNWSLTIPAGFGSVDGNYNNLIRLKYRVTDDQGLTLGLQTLVPDQLLHSSDPNALTGGNTGASINDYFIRAYADERDYKVAAGIVTFQDVRYGERSGVLVEEYNLNQFISGSSSEVEIDGLDPGIDEEMKFFGLSGSAITLQTPSLYEWVSGSQVPASNTDYAAGYDLYNIDTGTTTNPVSGDTITVVPATGASARDFGYIENGRFALRPTVYSFAAGNNKSRIVGYNWLDVVSDASTLGFIQTMTDEVRLSSQFGASLKLGLNWTTTGSFGPRWAFVNQGTTNQVNTVGWESSLYKSTIPASKAKPATLHAYSDANSIAMSADTFTSNYPILIPVSIGSDDFTQVPGPGLDWNNPYAKIAVSHVAVSNGPGASDLHHVPAAPVEATLTWVPNPGYVPGLPSADVQYAYPRDEVIGYWSGSLDLSSFQGVVSGSDWVSPSGQYPVDIAKEAFTTLNNGTNRIYHCQVVLTDAAGNSINNDSTYYNNYIGMQWPVAAGSMGIAEVIIYQASDADGDGTNEWLDADDNDPNVQ